MDFHELERLVDAIVMPWHNTHLNETLAFIQLNPSAENVAWFVAKALRLPSGVSLSEVAVWETPENCAMYHAG